MVGFGILALALWFSTLEVMDLSWRLRAALNIAVVSVAFLAFWPTLYGMSGGKIPCPEYVRAHVERKLVSGLDLRGGLRLVYTVDVEEAIKDKRNNYYEDMRLELTRVYGFLKDEERPTEETYKKLREKVDIEAPRHAADTILLKVKPGTDPTKIDDRFLERFKSELSYKRSQDGKSYDFHIRTSVETSIRERAVGQAREIIGRRVDELGLREAAVSTRDEDIIIEVPGEDEKSFATIRDIISQTARLEFKLLDDESDFFKDVASKATPESLKDIDFLQEQVAVGLDADGDVRSRVTYFASLKKQPNETMQQALTRFKEWVATLDVPHDREVGYEIDYKTVDEITGKQE
jgi:preprotein translocase subunit SecD